MCWGRGAMSTPRTAPGTAKSWAAEAARRVMNRCDELAEITSEPGWTTRFYLTSQHAAANHLVGQWCAEAGLEHRQDEAGNLRARAARHHGQAAVHVGSHLDSVTHAGRYDGILGVLMGLEVAGALAGSAAAPPVELLAFWDEEGGRFDKALLGSSAVAGLWQEEWLELLDDDGVSLRSALSDFGLDPAAVPRARLRPAETLGYLEAHIEQRPYLDRAGIPLGIVTSIAAARRVRIRVHGEARHVGTPLELRHDALAGASEVVLAVESLCASMTGLIAVVGELSVPAGAVNVVPGVAEFTVDVRASDVAGRERFAEALAERIDAVTAHRGLTWECELLHESDAATCSPRMRAAIRQGCADAGVAAPLELFSPAGHDAMVMAEVTEIGMIFLRNPDGISHSPLEAVSRDDVELSLIHI